MRPATGPPPGAQSPPDGAGSDTQTLRAADGFGVPTVARGPDTSPLTALERYLLGRVPAGQHVPIYGSAGFDAIDDPVIRAASVIRAAAAWRIHCSPEQVADDMRRQLAEEDEALWARIRSTSHEVAESRDWDALASSPTYAELQQRRAS